MPTQGRPDLTTMEVLNLQLDAEIPGSQEELEILTKPNMPWAETEFQERVGREPHNPHTSLPQWPYWTPGAAAATMTAGAFSHTYSERFWPEWPGYGAPEGIRYEYGNLDKVVDLLFEHPYTRQATFPIFFPEDTGGIHGGRVPCTLHYHFLMRDNRMHLWYAIRSCDAVRHFRDDLYLACRLCQWMVEELTEKEMRSDNDQLWVDVVPGLLHFTAYSFHYHWGDAHLL